MPRAQRASKSTKQLQRVREAYPISRSQRHQNIHHPRAYKSPMIDRWGNPLRCQCHSVPHSACRAGKATKIAEATLRSAGGPGSGSQPSINRPTPTNVHLPKTYWQPRLRLSTRSRASTPESFFLPNNPTIDAGPRAGDLGHLRRASAAQSVSR